MNKRMEELLVFIKQSRIDIWKDFKKYHILWPKIQKAEKEFAREAKKIK